MGNETKCYKNIELLEKRQQNKYNKRSSSRHSNSCNNNNNNEANAAVTAVAVKVKETVPSERVGSSNQATCCFKNSTDRERPSNNVCWFFLFYFFYQSPAPLFISSARCGIWQLASCRVQTSGMSSNCSSTRQAAV